MSGLFDPGFSSPGLLAALAGVFVFVGVATFFGWWRGSLRTILTWAAASVCLGALAGRAGHVVVNWDMYADSPIRILALWDGGISGQGVTGAVVLITAVAAGSRPGILRPALVAGVLGFVTWQGVTNLIFTPERTPISEMQFEQLDGTPFDLARLQGRPVVLNLWATWCGPCRREMPMMAEIASEMSDVTFVFANQREAPERIAFYLATERLSLPNVILDPWGDLGRAHASLGLPATIFIAGDGAVTSVHVGEISERDLRSAIENLQSKTPQEE